ncbi:MAG: adenylate/guanylate cyclase domain-containing protein [Proteobacteria bacterium]|nr:adenylate/guanylate cyclase domain-containing protein [Pseudomonadota bacterium]
MSDGQAQAAPVGAVTIVFTDIVGSTGLWERHEEAMSAALRSHDALLRDCIARNAGYEVKAEGDAFMVVFSEPRLAVAFCLEVQEELVDVDWPEAIASEPAAATETGFRGLRVRMGIHTGAPLARLNPMTGRTDYFGPVVNRAARVSGAAAGGQILVSGPVWLGVEDDFPGVVSIGFGQHRLKGIPEPVDLVQILPGSLASRRLPAPLNEAADLTANIPIFGFLHRIGGARYAFPVTRRVVTIGRSSTCDLVLAEDGVSKVHCALRIDPEGGFHISDEGSTNGTSVNDRLMTRGTLSDGDRLRIGDVEFRVQVGRKQRAQAQQADELHTVATRVLRKSDLHGKPSPLPYVLGGLVVVGLVIAVALAAAYMFV